MVLFGTGQYIQTTDVASTAQQSLYGVRDNGAVVADRYEPGAAERHGECRALVATPIARSPTMRWTTPPRSGWYMDLPTAGERVMVDPILRQRPIHRAHYQSRVPIPALWVVTPG